MQKKLLATIITSLVAGQGIALEVMNNGTSAVAIGGRIGIITQTEKGKTTANNDGSRLHFSFEHQLTDSFSGFAMAEWGFKPHNEYNERDATGDTVKVKSSEFRNRLGHIGVTHEQWGTVAFGKQWSVYSDVASWTDEFAVGGGKAMGIYNGFTDEGDYSGTGLADDALTYRGEFGGLKVGLQYQLRGSSYKDDRKITSSATDATAGDVERQHGYQLAVSYGLDMGLTFGATFSETKFDIALNDSEEDGLKSRAAVAAVKYDMNDIYVALSYGRFGNHTTAQWGMNTATFVSASNPTPPARNNYGLDKQSEGVELYGRYKLSQLLDGGISLQGGWNMLKVKKDNNDNDSEAKLDNIMLGALYEIGPMQLAAEYIWQNGKYGDPDSSNTTFSPTAYTTEYKDRNDVFLLQARYYF